MRREYYLITTVLLALILSVSNQAWGDSRLMDNPYAEEFVTTTLDTIPINDRTGDYISDPNTNPFDLKDPKIIDKSINFDPGTGTYIIEEKIGEEYFRPPSYMTMEEYLDYQKKKQQDDYFKELSGVNTGERGLGGKIDPLADIDVKESLVDRLFGGTEVDIRPQGSIDLTFGVEFNRSENPQLPQRQQRTGGFDFDMAIQMDVEGSIGEKLKLNTNYNTQATFDFDNVMKLQYGTDDFGEDEIIKSIEAGNVALPLRGTLITGSESLFGLKVETQWGRLRLTGVASQQKSEREQVVIENGGQLQEFSVSVDEYDENRHFFISHYNRETYEEALSQLPRLNTNFSIEEIQVFVKPTTGNQSRVYEVVAFTDLGEPTRINNSDFEDPGPVPPNREDIEDRPLPDNDANLLYEKLQNGGEALRLGDQVVSQLESSAFGLEQGEDFERITAVLLDQNQFTFHPQLGFISLGVNVQVDQVVAVSYRYSYQNEIFTVGEFTDNTDGGDTTSTGVIFSKMLKTTANQPSDIVWDLMMKNVYSINGFQIGQEDFRLDILYADAGINNEAFGEGENQIGKKRFLPVPGLDKEPLIRLFGLDRLNSVLDPQPEGDGRFDFVPGITILPRTGKIIFPKLEPFGDFIRDTIKSVTGDQNLAEAFAFDTLYSETVTVAREQASQNRFTIEGQYKSEVSGDISLGAFNIQGEVYVRAGGRLLQEGADYTIDKTIGRIRILNEAILASGSKITVDFEDSALFGFQTKTMLGVRADYEVNKNLIIGGTYMQLFERPFTQKVNIGDDPINNRMYGLDLNYSDEAPWLTKLVDKIPGIDTKEASSITVVAEGAYLKPGHSRAINETSDTSAFNQDEKGGVIYIDDFEGTTSQLTQIFPTNGPNGWVLASTPRNDMFPEANLINDTDYGVNRAKLNWMSIQPQFLGDADANPYATQVDITEIFPNRTIQQQGGIQNNIVRSLDIQYCPDQRGPYNFDVPGGTNYSEGLDPNGRLNDPGSRWGGIMRAVTTNDFQASNIEFIEFWMLNPFLDTLNGGATPNLDAATGKMNGDIYIELGNISEDVLRDSRKFYENGLPGPNTQGLRTVATEYGEVPITQQVTTNFDIDPENRESQDVGFDGIPDADERITHAEYLNQLQGVIDNTVFNQIRADPSNDNFRSFNDYDPEATTFERYSRFYGMEGNSPTAGVDDNVRQGSQLQPDTEDLDRDNTLNELESYFQYRVPIEYDGVGGLDRDNPFIIDQITSDDGLRTWYRFKIPLNVETESENFKKVGNINNFRSIRFMRMYFKEFESTMNFRFGTFDLVRSQWRRFIDEGGIFAADGGCPLTGAERAGSTSFDVNAVSIEETTGYTLPPGIVREQALGINQNARQNEQALSLTVCDLNEGAAEAIYKLVNMDMRQFKRMRMFVHGESSETCEDLSEPETGDLSVFVRLGSDFTQNYYEYEIPIEFTQQSDMGPDRISDSDYNRVIWPAANEINIDFESLVRLKRRRNKENFSLLVPYYVDGADELAAPDLDIPLSISRPDERYAIIGNPNLGDVQSIMIGVRHPCDGDASTQSAEVWVNELRVFGLDEEGGAAATARVDFNMADFATLTLSGLASTDGFGQINQRVNERQRESILTYDIATQIKLDKFLPEKWGVNLPFYYQYTKEIETPEYDPYDLDVKLEDKVSDQDTQEEKDLVKERAKTITTLKTWNFTNVSKEPTKKDKPSLPWDVSNFSLDVGFNQTTVSDPYIKKDVAETRYTTLTYSYKTKMKPIKPFDKVIKNKNLKFIKDINFNPLPKSFSFATNLERQFKTREYRFAGDDILQTTYFQKLLTWNRSYDVAWDPFKALKIRYFADFQGIIDEPTEKSMIRRSRLDPSDPNYIADIDSYRRDSIFTNARNLGRPKDFRQNISLRLDVPINKLPYLDWVTAKANYEGGYHFAAASLDPFAASFGNVIENNQARSLEMDFKFDKLYKRFKYLKKIESKPRTRRGRNDTSKGKDDKDKKGREKDNKKDKKDKKDKDDKKKKDRQPSKLERILIRPLLLIRSLEADINQDFATIVPGYASDIDLFGMKNFDQPGWDFVFGLQPNLAIEDQFTDRNWLYENRDYFVQNERLYDKVTQSKSTNYRGRLKIEPFKDFKLDITAERTLTETHMERFAFNPDVNDFQHAIINDAGTYEISYFSMQTLFKDNQSELRELFGTYLSNLVTISERLAGDDTRLHEDPTQRFLGFRYGYGQKHPSVATYAFLAAYTDRDAETIEIAEDYTETLFDELPRVNWRFNYTGLSKLKMFKNIFQTIKISHGYQSRMSVSSFASNLEYDFNQPVYQSDSRAFNYVSRFSLPTLQITEAFSPLIGIDVRLKNGMSIRFDIDKQRDLNLRADAENLIEGKTTDWAFGFAHTMKGVEFDFLSKKKKKGKKKEDEKKEEEANKKKKSPISGRGGGGGQGEAGDLTLSLDFSYRDDISTTYNYNYGEEFTDQPDRGDETITINPAIEYRLSSQLALRLFYDFRRSTPKIGLARQTNWATGVTVRFQLE